MVVQEGDQFEEQTHHPYPVKSVVITTCGPLYDEWSSRKRMYGKAAKGLTVKVDYADTEELCQSKQPITIVALHGAPGSHEDFQPFIEYFGARNVRIIVPNYPGKEGNKRVGWEHQTNCLAGEFRVGRDIARRQRSIVFLSFCFSDEQLSPSVHLGDQSASLH